MKLDVVLQLLFILVIYSFLGWILEVITIAIKEKRFVNRGVLNGPMCLIYGCAALLLTIALADVKSIAGLFIGSMIYCTALEFIAGKILEKVNKNKWWDYSKKKYNLDGYICLEYSLIWGVLGTIAIKIFSPLFLGCFQYINIYVRLILVIASLSILALDLLTSFLTLKQIKNNQIEKMTDRFGNWIFKAVQKRMEYAYPNIKRKRKREKSEIFAQGCSFYKLFCIFLIAAFLGDIIEIIYCRFSMHRFMSRSSVIWGQFSLVWGLALLFATLLLHRYQNKSNLFLFIFGTIMGGAFEYACSVFTEFFFGTIFWDYSKIPLNINGRINLLFCFFWGFATILFIKGIYPYLSKRIEMIPKRVGITVCNMFFVFLLIDLFVTGCVMLRYTNRLNGVEAQNIVDKLCDKYADDEFMQKRWSNMKFKR